MRKVIEWYKPSIGIPNWNIRELSKEERNKLRNRIVMGTVHTEQEYQTVIGYMYKKFPHLMDITGKVTNPFTNETTENTSIQWNYTPWKNKTLVHNDFDSISKIYDMYAFIYYDKERDYEPIAFAGSYFKNAKININDLTYDNERTNRSPEINSAIGEGYVMFVDPYYRRLGLGNYSWTAEAQLYREISNSTTITDTTPMIIPVQMEIQNEYSVKSTISCFPISDNYPLTDVTDPDQLIFGEHNKHLLITSNGRVKNDGSRCQIRLLMNYNDEQLINDFKTMPQNMKEIYNKPHWEFLDREAKNNNISIDEYKKILLEPWN